MGEVALAQLPEFPVRNRVNVVRIAIYEDIDDVQNADDVCTVIRAASEFKLA